MRNSQLIIYIIFRIDLRRSATILYDIYIYIYIQMQIWQGLVLRSYSMYGWLSRFHQFIL
ncbi:MAG: hypothetical protein ACI90V_002241 [Bacillariaceae sp.]|jgi:hypothetical protein